MWKALWKAVSIPSVIIILSLLPIHFYIKQRFPTAQIARKKKRIAGIIDTNNLQRGVTFCSWTSFFCSLMASSINAGLHFVPTHSRSLCEGLFSADLVMYVMALFSFKFKFLLRLKILNANAHLIKSACLLHYVDIMPVWLLLCLIGCIVLVIRFVHAEAELDHGDIGCWTHFEYLPIYVAMAMIAYDIANFLLYDWYWRVVMRKLKNSCADKPDRKKVLRSAKDTFNVEAACFALSMVFCAVNVATNAVRGEAYDAMPLFIADYTVTAICNFVMLHSRFICSLMKTRTQCETQLADYVTSSTRAAGVGSTTTATTMTDTEVATSTDATVTRTMNPTTLEVMDVAEVAMETGTMSAVETDQTAQEMMDDAEVIMQTDAMGTEVVDPMTHKTADEAEEVTTVPRK